MWQVHYYISTEKADMVTIQFEKFNSDYMQLERVFLEVTGTDFEPGQRFPMDVKEKQVSCDF